MRIGVADSGPHTCGMTTAPPVIGAPGCPVHPGPGATHIPASGTRTPSRKHAPAVGTHAAALPVIAQRSPAAHGVVSPVGSCSVDGEAQLANVHAPEHI